MKHITLFPMICFTLIKCVLLLNLMSGVEHIMYTSILTSTVICSYPFPKELLRSHQDVEHMLQYHLFEIGAVKSDVLRLKKSVQNSDDMVRISRT